jgi:hypothetical protein
MRNTTQSTDYKILNTDGSVMFTINPLLAIVLLVVVTLKLIR